METYTSDVAALAAIEPSIDWDALTIVTTDAAGPGDAGVVCISALSESGTTFAIGDIAFGQAGATHYGFAACPAELTPEFVAAMD